MPSGPAGLRFFFQAPARLAEDQVVHPHPKITGLPMGVVELELGDQIGDLSLEVAIALRLFGHPQDSLRQQIGKVILGPGAVDRPAQINKEVLPAAHHSDPEPVIFAQSLADVQAALLRLEIAGRHQDLAPCPMCANNRESQECQDVVVGDY